MLTWILATLIVAAGLALAVRTVRCPAGPFAIVGDTLLEDYFGNDFAKKVHLALAATLAAFGVLFAIGVFER